MSEALLKACEIALTNDMSTEERLAWFATLTNEERVAVLEVKANYLITLMGMLQDPS